MGVQTRRTVVTVSVRLLPSLYVMVRTVVVVVVTHSYNCCSSSSARTGEARNAAASAPAAMNLFM